MSSPSKSTQAQNIKSRLSIPLITGVAKEVKITAPVVDMQIVVTIDQLRPFKWNPRTTRNSRYDEIKASIKAVGLDHAPNITQLPGDDKYTVRDGGNTRLQILNELWEETGDLKFYEIKCVFRPFTNNISMIVGHLSENDNRGDLKWIERANALKVAKNAYLDIDKLEDISTRDLVKRLESDGYKISRSHVVKMFQTINHILPSLPSLLHSGMGRPQVEKILSYRQASKAIWDCCSLPVDGFDEAFHEVLHAFDTDEHEALPFSAIHDSLLGMFVNKTNVHFNVIDLTFDLIIKSKGRSIDDCLEALKDELGIPLLPKKEDKASSVVAHQVNKDVVNDDNQVDLTSDGNASHHSEKSEEQDELPFLEDLDSNELNASETEKLLPVDKITPDGIRKDIRSAVRKLARWAGFDVREDGSGAVVLSNEGCGYLMQPLNFELDSVSLEAQIIWQILAGLNGAYNPEYPSDPTIIGNILGTVSAEGKGLPDLELEALFDLVRSMRNLESFKSAVSE